jgi:hypothetical protein
MKRTRTILTGLLVIAFALLGTQQAAAYGLFSGDPGFCTQCHSDWPEAGHTVHDALGCTACHVNGVGVDPVEVGTCAGCHPANGMFDLHSPLQGPGDGLYCGDCHAGVLAEPQSWSQLRELFD